MQNQVFVGIDVSKAKLDVALRPCDESFSVTNNQRGLATLVKRLQKLSVSRIVLEASGGYEIAAASELAAADLPVAVVNPRQVRDFARATDRLAKTDAIDADPGAFRRTYSARNAALARRAEPGTDGTGRPSPPGGRNADRRE